jgi:hypothetical protein
MLAITGPVARSKQKIGDFPQTGARVPRVHGLQGK